METNSEIEEIKKQVELAKEKFYFEKYKYRVELFKWLIVSVGLVIITMVINYSFKDREAGLTEIEMYDKYVTELIVLNQDIGQKRMLAQFFSHVTPSEKLRDGWKNYYSEIEVEYRNSLSPVIKNDSIIREDYFKLKSKPDSLSTEEIKKLEVLERQLIENKKLLNPRIVLPKRDYGRAISWEKQGFQALLERDIEDAINSFQNSENSYNQFHQAFEITNYLNKNRERLESADSDYWKTAFKHIAEKYSWKMPEEIKEKLLGSKEN